jgi:hypothetical protein
MCLQCPVGYKQTLSAISCSASWSVTAFLGSIPTAHPTSAPTTPAPTAHPSWLHTFELLAPTPRIHCPLGQIYTACAPAPECSRRTCKTRWKGLRRCKRRGCTARCACPFSRPYEHNGQCLAFHECPASPAAPVPAPVPAEYPPKKSRLPTSRTHCTTPLSPQGCSIPEGCTRVASLRKNAIGCLVYPCGKLQCVKVDCVAAKQWHKWSACDRSCGHGMRYRTRDVSRNSSHGGRPCEATDVWAAKPCKESECPPDG